MLLFQIILATTLVSLMSFIGIIAIFKNISLKDHTLKLMISLAAGSLLAISFLDLLPEALAENKNPNNIFIAVLISFLAFFILEKYIHWHHCKCSDHNHKKKQTKPNIIYTNLIGDGFHNLIDGFLIAAAFMLDFKTGIIATIVVIIHEIPQEISDFSILIYAGLSKAQAIFYNFLFALTSIFGGIIFYFFGSQFTFLVPYMAAFAAGNFIYLATADLIPELHQEDEAKQVMLHTLWLFIGIAIISLLIFFSPEIG